MTTLEPVKEAPAPLTPEASGPYDPEMKEAGQLTSPTWELELFLSGAFVFATFQLPDLIEQAFEALEPHATETMQTVLFTGTMYAKAIAFTLMGMFLIHLISRAYWVALLGLQSVFPGGVNWSKMRIGPITRGVFQNHVPNISQAISRLDNFCSLAFSAGLMIVLIFAYATMLVGVVSAVAYGLAMVFTHGQNMRYFFFTLMFVFVAIPVGSMLIDRRKGHQLVPGTRAYRAVKQLVIASYSINMVRVIGPMVWTVSTNLGQKKALGLMYGALIVLIFLSTIDRLARSDRLSINSYDYFAASRDHQVAYRFYENQREPGKAYPRTPSIQSDIIRDPYIKLFIPFYPRRDNAAIAKACPTVKPIQERGIQLGADAPVPDSLALPVLECIARIRTVSIDGVARPDVEFSFYEQPTTGLKGVIAYIAVDSLAHGRHILGVVPMPPVQLPKDTAALRAAEWKKPTPIPFWR